MSTLIPHGMKCLINPKHRNTYKVRSANKIEIRCACGGELVAGDKVAPTEYPTIETMMDALNAAYAYFAALTGRNEEINDAEHVGDVPTGMVINSDGLDELFDKAATKLAAVLGKPPL